jgi:DNA-directed RNA polymerase specialized sigma24 family protein
MRRARHRVEGARLPLYEWIIERYACYVLVRCAWFTNSRGQAQRMGVYTLITTCLLTHELDHLGQLGFLVETMADVIGPDIVLSGAAADPWGGSDEPLLADPRMRRLAEALNLLPRPQREMLILRHVTRMKAGALAKLFHRPPARIAAQVRRAERRLAECLTDLHAGGGKTGRPGVMSLLAEFEAGLDMVWLREVRAGTLHYLIRHDEPGHQLRGH